MEDETRLVTGSPPAERTIAVVGTVNFDRIVAESGETFESLGGILYSGLVLAELLEASGVRVALYARIGEAHRRDVAALFADRPGVDLRGIIVDPRGTNVSRLEYSHGGERAEEVELRVPPLDESDLRGVERAEAVLVNMISGRDVALGTLERVRAHAVGRFFLDIQALARTQESPRHPHLVPDWTRWARLFHTVRGNETEISWFAGVPEDAALAAERILDEGPEEVLVTRGAAGSVRYARETSGFRGTPVAPVPRTGPIDSTGCGDAYDAACVAGRALGLSGMDAARLGSHVGSEIAGVHGLTGVARLHGLRLRLASRDPAFAPFAGGEE